MDTAPRQQPSATVWSELLRVVKGCLRFFDRIHWKLTLSYTLVSVLVVLVLILLLTTGGIWFASRFYYGNIPAEMARQADLIAPYFADETTVQATLATWLASQERFAIEDVFGGEAIQFELQLGETSKLHILDGQQRLLVSSDGAVTELRLNPSETALLENTLLGQKGRLLNLRVSPPRLLISTPVLLNDRAVGSIIFTEDFTDIGASLAFISLVLLVISVLAALLSTLLGFIGSRGLTGRLKRLENASTAWQQGNFGTRVHDPSGDELGRLTASLNHMAGELASHVSTRQELATLEERNRLALELHDSVKQQVFAIGMKLGVAESLAGDDALRKSLNNLGELAHQTQTELERLIHNLKPVALGQASLTSALKTYLESWEALHAVNVSYTLDVPQSLANPVEQALFRVIQESLANVARHARANQLSLTFQQRDGDLVLSIRDDGCGFDPETVTRGLGHYSMLERVRQLGGSLKLGSEAGQGTHVEVRLPLERSV